MVAPQINPEEEGKRIAREYLSGLGWGRQWQQTLGREVYPAYDRETIEAKFRQADQRIDNAEDKFSAEVDGYLRDSSANSKIVLETIYKILGRRNDLGFFGRRVMGHIRNRLGLF